MAKGIIFALLACFIWGLIFIVPIFMEGFNSFEVALGRHSVYGLISLLIFSKAWTEGKCRYPKLIWLKAIKFSVILSITYYTFVVLALRYSTPAICALILGISPIAIAFYGNWMQKECTYKSLILPSILILLGLLMINLPHLESHDSPSEYILGIVFALLALAAWSWYVVANSRFLKDHPDVPANDWSTLIGVSTLFWVILSASILFLFFEEQFVWQKFFVLDSNLINFLTGCAVLGIICSWIGAFLWNRASVRLPVSLAGQLTIFETIFGVFFFYILEGTIPPLLECVGIIIMLSAIGYGIRSSMHPQHST